jgi:hypothetical protein
MSADGITRDITNLVHEIQIRQDMYLGFMSGELSVVDAADIYSQAALHGNEYLFVHIREPEQDICIKKAFRVYKVGERTAAQNNSQRFNLYFCSEELFISNSRKISKAYSNTLVSDVVLDILKNSLNVPQDRIVVEETETPFDYVAPWLHPLDILNWLASRAHADGSSAFFFYENLNGFNFRSLQSIYKDGTIIKVPFKFEQKSVDKAIGMDKYAIDSYESKRDFDTIRLMQNGGVSLLMHKVDTLNRTHDTVKYGMDDIATLYKNPLLSNPNTTDNKPLFDQSETYALTYLNLPGIDSWVKRVLSMAALTSNSLELVLPGSIRLQAGTLINCKFPYASTPVEGDMWDKRKSGKYLIVAVNQKFDLVNHKWDTIVMITRDSLPEALPPPDTRLAEKVKKLNSKSHRD